MKQLRYSIALRNQSVTTALITALQQTGARCELRRSFHTGPWMIITAPIALQSRIETLLLTQHLTWTMLIETVANSKNDPVH